MKTINSANLWLISQFKKKKTHDSQDGKLVTKTLTKLKLLGQKFSANLMKTTRRITNRKRFVLVEGKLEEKFS